MCYSIKPTSDFLTQKITLKIMGIQYFFSKISTQQCKIFQNALFFHSDTASKLSSVSIRQQPLLILCNSFLFHRKVELRQGTHDLQRNTMLQRADFHEVPRALWLCLFVYVFLFFAIKSESTYCSTFTNSSKIILTLHERN